ncbi:hypothetical protein B484DRAFT_402700 [Ochromonadaceae sp. CCMP2298]|nr:hypothetical protein B484DRAFT_402700 [Ochromonadaceae sp. CCMP2298]
MIHRALASSSVGDADKILIHGGMTGVAVKGKLPQPNRIDVDQVVKARMVVLRNKVHICFTTLLNAIQPPTPMPHDPALGTPITANDVLRRTAEVVAGRTAAELSTDLIEDKIRAQTETKEGVRRRSEKSFEEVQAATLGVFYQTFAAELLSAHAVDLKASRFRS